jgi:hypothetical protein
MGAPATRGQRRHLRAHGRWPVRVTTIDEAGQTTQISATAIDISVSGMLLETAVASNLSAEKPVAITLPDDVGTVGAVVRRFVDHAEGGHPNVRWAVELAGLTFVQRARWARFVFIAARLERDGGRGGLPDSSV